MCSLFGTDGIRGRVGEGMFTQTPLVALGAAIGLWMQEMDHMPGTVAIGNDSRASAGWITDSLCKGLHSVQSKTYNIGVVSTPMASHIIKAMLDVDIVLIISASHNPAEDNGIKIFHRSKGKISPIDELTISERFYSCVQKRSYEDSVLASSLASPALNELYTTTLRSWFPAPMALGKRIIVDTAHGATSHLAYDIFQVTGAEIILINNKPDGHNINRSSGSVHPTSLQQAVLNYKGDLGFAFDGDGDRVIAVDKKGIVKDGDDLLCILLQHQHYRHLTQLVGTVMSNAGLEYHLINQGKSLVRTAVGDRHIAEELIKQQLPLGGEPSGHIILRDKTAMGDGILVALTVLETLAKTDNWSMSTFTKLPQKQTVIPVSHRPDLTQQPFSSIIQKAYHSLPQGRILVRYSGTEPLLRIMVEANEEELADTLCSRLAYELHHALLQETP